MSARGGKKKGKGAKKKAPSWRCSWCQTSKTSYKAQGPKGPKTLYDRRARSTLDGREDGTVLCHKIVVLVARRRNGLLRRPGNRWRNIRSALAAIRPSSFLIFVRTGHSAKSWSPRAAGRKAVAVTNGGAEAAAAAARTVTRRSIIKFARRSRLSAPRSRRGDSWGSVRS